MAQQFIITGASRGIGRHLLQKYVSEGKSVFGLYNLTALDTSLSQYYYKVDICREDEIFNFVEKNKDKFEKIVLINCAGTNINSVVHKTDLDAWEKVIRTNLTGTFLIIKHLLQIMRANGFGRIVNFSSIVPQIGTPGTISYASSKAALWGLTKVVAKENAQKGITCNCLDLGYFDIGMITEVPSEILAKITESIPMKKLGNPINIYNAIEFLINSDYITGSAIDINGGLF
jgi:NAD(P)-dependent dehydrogenase (short-subunit alcohol dehydrogenase family)